jgi:hypothetical protein
MNLATGLERSSRWRWLRLLSLGALTWCAACGTSGWGSSRRPRVRGLLAPARRGRPCSAGCQAWRRHHIPASGKTEIAVPWGDGVTLAVQTSGDVSGTFQRMPTSGHERIT